MVDFNKVRPHDALGGKTPAEVYRDSPRRSLAPLVPSYPDDWKTRRVSRNGNVSLNDDVVFVSQALVGHIIGLRQEDALRWHAYFFGVDLGTIEIIPSLGDMFSSGPVTTLVNRAKPAARGVNGPDARQVVRTKKTVNAW